MKESINHPNRRKFLTAGLTGGLALAALPTLAAAKQADDTSFELSELSIADLQDGMQYGMQSDKYASRSLAEKYLARIEAIDRQGPALRSVIEVNPDAMELAVEQTDLDDRHAAHRCHITRQPLQEVHSVDHRVCWCGALNSCPEPRFIHKAS